MASFIELIAKIKQKNNGTFKLVDAQDVECEDGKGLDEVLNEKLDKNLGAENKDKVLVTDVEGNITTQNKENFEGGGTTNYNDLENKPQINGVELSGNVTSEDLGIIAKNDNFLYKDVAKQLNPNITDSFQRAMWNLKLYGQSTQGADPSPTNPQSITAISQFEGAPTGKNLFDMSTFVEENFIYQTLSQKCMLVKLKPNTTYTISRDGTGGYQSGQYLYIYNDINSAQIGQIINSNVQVNKQNITFTTLDTGYLYIGYNKVNNSLQKILEIIKYIQIEEGTIATPYEPYQSQPFTYTPTQNMYSTQDGSICDYVDVENGVEVYNMKPITFNNTQMSSVAYIGSTTSGYSKFTFMLPYNSVIDRKINTIISCSALEGPQGAWYTDKINIISGDNNSKNIYYANVDGSITTKEDFLALFENDVELVYVLETPTETPIPQEQLAMLKALYTYTGVTNFLCNAPVSFTYERSLQIVINNLGNAIGQTNANILLNGGNN